MRLLFQRQTAAAGQAREATVFLPYIKNGELVMEYLYALINYLAFCIVEGDYLNDHLAEFPAGEVRDILIEIGMSLAVIMGN